LNSARVPLAVGSRAFSESVFMDKAIMDCTSDGNIDIITILSKGQCDGENKGSISSIFGPDHSVVRWPGANVPVWCIFPVHRHRSLYCFIFLFITNHKIASENSIIKWAQKDGL
jgi:hypothetical protein